MAPHRNLLLADAVERAGLTNKALARSVRQVAAEHGLSLGTDHVSVRRWLDGVEPRGDTPTLIAEALGRKLGEPLSPRDIGMAYAEPSQLGARDGPLTTEDLVSDVSTLVVADLAKSRALLDAGPDPHAWESSIVLSVVAPPASTVPTDGLRVVDQRHIEAVLATTQAFMDLDFRFGGGHARTALVQYLASEIEPLLKIASAGTPLGCDFLSAVACAMQQTGWMAYDAGFHGVAQQYFCRSLELARAANDGMLCGRLLACMSHQANYLRHFTFARNLARAAQMTAPNVATPTAMAMFHSMEARALASVGDERACTQALLSAERAFAKRSPADDPEWLSYFDDAELAGEFAHCFMDLGQYHQAQEHVLHSVEQSEAQYVRSLTFVRTILAASHFAEGDLDSGIAVTREVVASAADLQSARAQRNVTNLVQSLTRWDQREVRELQDEIQGLATTI